MIDAAIREHIALSRQTNSDFNSYLHAAWHIRDAMPQALSIDNFIDQQNDERIELCGKLAIVNSILEAESASDLFISDLSKTRQLDFESLDNAWHNKFLRLLTDGCRLKDLPKRLSKISFVSFNYDRCIEHFLINALRNYYQIDESEAADILSHLEIHHPYGKVGDLPWENNGRGIEYGASISGSSLLDQAQRIKTFTEQVDDQRALSKLRHSVDSADKVIFLGFGYHGQNLDLLNPQSLGLGLSWSSKKVFGTAKGISKHDVSIVREQLGELFGLDTGSDSLVIDNKLTCSQLFDEFWRSISIK